MAKETQALRMFKIVLALALIILAGSAAWQVAAWEIANMNLQEDIRDMASQAGARVGVVVPNTDEDENRAVIRKAKEHGIDLTPDQVTVRRTTSGPTSTVYLAADYTVPVKLLAFSFRLHFTPSTEKRSQFM
jgi:hypothetical protein